MATSATSKEQAWGRRIAFPSSPHPLSVREWLAARGVSAGNIVTDSVFPSWLCPRTSEPAMEPECFAARVGAPPLDGLVCRHPLQVEDPTLNRSMQVTVWRLEGARLRRVLQAVSLCEAQVELDGPTELTVGSPCSLASLGEEVSAKVDIGIGDPALRRYLSDPLLEGQYGWHQDRFVRRHPGSP